ncbi:TspO/MBR family protein [Clostridium rectalis]|uniref:TspO/MBR family protein n=1 Tax=Clostridium rectalis TaxID=2040295 RepID=UPI000F63C451|nr:TspO/MBR family protein [Clostridium rectalis]
MKKNIFKVNGKSNIGTLLISILIAELIGMLSALFSGDIRGVFQSLQKPSFAPSANVFLIVWIILYALMGIAVYRIWMIGKEGIDVKMALKFYNTQLLLNFLWSIIFFRFGLIELAFFELMLLICFVILTILEFYRYDKIAAKLMIPYLLWIIFAAVLNCFIWILN